MATKAPYRKFMCKKCKHNYKAPLLLKQHFDKHPDHMTKEQKDRRGYNQATRVRNKTGNVAADVQDLVKATRPMGKRKTTPRGRGHITLVKFCPSCGTDLQRKANTPARMAWEFCFHCGERFPQL